MNGPERRAWILNFDADDELASPTSAARSEAMVLRFPDLASRVGPLLAPGDVLLDPAAVLAAAAGTSGRAWCPTPRALAALARAGAELPAAPELDVLRRANHRALSARIGQTLPGARYVRSWPELEATLAEGAGDAWLLKRAFGFAGRGRRKVRATDLHGAARTWIEASLRSEGLQVEPWVERSADFALHGFLERSGDLHLGAPTLQEVQASGAWTSTVRAPASALAQAEQEALRAEAQRAASALRAEGYFGPFGVDAFRWVSTDGTAAFNPRCEINARYSMGWAVGMGPVRPDL